MTSLLDVVAFVASRVSARRPSCISLNDGFALVASRVAPRQAPHFLLLRQEKVSKEKATRVRVSLRCAKGNLRCSQQAGSLQTRLSPQTCNLLYPPVAALLGTRTREVEGIPPCFASVCSRSNCLATATQPASTPTKALSKPSSSPFLHLRWCKAPAAAPGIPVPAPLAPVPCGCAEQRSEARKKRDACLSPQGEFAARPRFASSAGCPAAQRRGRKHQGRLSLAYVSLAKQRKVSRPPGRDPASTEGKTIKQRSAVRSPDQDPACNVNQNTTQK
jgi:hypothetical protein